MLLVQTVLTTHSQFVSAPELLQLLLARFHIQLPPDATADDRAFFSQHHRGIQVKYVTRTLAPARCGGGGKTWQGAGAGLGGARVAFDSASGRARGPRQNFYGGWF